MEDFKIANYYGLDYKVYPDGTIVGPKRGKSNSVKMQMDIWKLRLEL